MSDTTTLSLSAFNPAALDAANWLCYRTDNSEYVRGIAELLIDTTPNTYMDQKDDLIRYLIAHNPSRPSESTAATLDCGHTDEQPDVAHSSRPDGLDACCEACCWLCQHTTNPPHLVIAETGKDLGPATIQHVAVAENHPWGWVRVNPATLRLNPNGILCWLDDGEPF